MNYLTYVTQDLTIAQAYLRYSPNQCMNYLIYVTQDLTIAQAYLRYSPKQWMNDLTYVTQDLKYLHCLLVGGHVKVAQVS